jgi:hypothetical protein
LIIHLQYYDLVLLYPLRAMLIASSLLFFAHFQELGATVERGGLRFGLSHMIWSHGNPKLVHAAQLMDIVVVSPLWVEQCREARARVSEAEFCVSVGPVAGAPAASASVALPVARSIPIPGMVLSPAKKSAAANMEPHIDQAKSLRDPDSPFFSSSQRQVQQAAVAEEGGGASPAAAEDWRKDKGNKQRLRQERTPRRNIVVLEKKALIHSALDISQSGVKHIIIDSASYEHLKSIEDDLAQEMDAIKNASSSPLMLPQFRRIPTPERIPIPPVPLPLVDADDDDRHTVKRRRFSERLCDFRSDSDDDTIDTRSKRVPGSKSSKASNKKVPSPPAEPLVAVVKERQKAKSSAPVITAPPATSMPQPDPPVHLPSQVPPPPAGIAAASKTDQTTAHDGKSTASVPSSAGDAAQGAESAPSSSSSSSTEPDRPWWINTRINARISHISSVSTRRLRGSGMKIAFSGFGREEDFLTLSSIASAVELRYLDAAGSHQGGTRSKNTRHRSAKKETDGGSDSDENEEEEEDDGEEVPENLLVLGESPCLLTPSENLDIDYPCSIIVKKIENSEKTG